MRKFVLALAMCCFPAWASAAPAECRLPLGATVPDTATARAIALAVISAQQTSAVSKKYRLFVGPDSERAGSWEASQTLAQPRNRAPKAITVTMGGGGIHMHINRCTGEISDMYYYR
jgi:hypothetical protein